MAMAMAADEQNNVSTVLEEFRAGVTATLRSWSVLRTSVESGWGGVDSVRKADDLRLILYEHFDGSSFPPKKLDPQDLEDHLAIYMEEEYSVTLEDGSERQIAETIFRLYEAAHRGDSSLAQQMVAQCNQATAAIASYPCQVQTMEHDDDDDDEDMNDADDTTVPTLQPTAPSSSLFQQQLSAAEYAEQSLFGQRTDIIQRPQPNDAPPARQLGEAAPIAEAPMVDDDGFAPVSSNTRSKTRKSGLR